MKAQSIAVMLLAVAAVASVSATQSLDATSPLRLLDSNNDAAIMGDEGHNFVSSFVSLNSVVERRADEMALDAAITAMSWESISAAAGSNGRDLEERQLFDGSQIVALLPPQQQQKFQEAVNKLPGFVRTIIFDALHLKIQKGFLGNLVKQEVGKFYKLLPANMQQNVDGVVALLPPDLRQRIEGFIHPAPETVAPDSFKLMTFFEKLPENQKAKIKAVFDKLPRAAKLIVVDIANEPIPTGIVNEIVKKQVGEVLQKLPEIHRRTLATLISILPPDVQSKIKPYLPDWFVAGNNLRRV